MIIYFLSCNRCALPQTIGYGTKSELIDKGWYFHDEDTCLCKSCVEELDEESEEYARIEKEGFIG